MPSTLDELTPGLDRIAVDLLGDTIEYAADGTTFVERQAYVDYRDADKAFEGAKVIEQDITVEGLLIADVPVEPSATCRLRLARLPGLTFFPINVRRDDSGTGWDFEVRRA